MLEALAILNCSIRLHKAQILLITKINLLKNLLRGTTAFDAPTNAIIRDVQNNECNKHMDNHSKSKLVIHSTHPACCLHHHILAPECFGYLSNN